MTWLVPGFNACSAAAALVAAILWWRASRVVVAPQETIEGGFASAGISIGLPDGREMDFLATVQEGARLNAAAAATAAVAALFQAVGLVADLFK